MQLEDRLDELEQRVGKNTSFESRRIAAGHALGKDLSRLQGYVYSFPLTDRIHKLSAQGKISREEVKDLLLQAIRQELKCGVTRGN